MDGTDTARAGSGIKFRYMRSHWGDAFGWNVSLCIVPNYE